MTHLKQQQDEIINHRNRKTILYGVWYTVVFIGSFKSFKCPLFAELQFTTK